MTSVFKDHPRLSVRDEFIRRTPEALILFAASIALRNLPGAIASGVTVLGQTATALCDNN